MKPVFIGCSGWNYREWRGRLYPEREPQRRWLELYAERFGTVEINATFYRLPRRDTVTRWVEQTPSSFVFAVKVSRYLTHIKRLTGVEQGMELFYERIAPMFEAGRLGPLLWQLPENFHRDDDRLQGWLEALPEGRHAIEFRHQSWFEDDVIDALRARGVALVVCDHPQRPFQLHVPTTSWWFIRFHYGSRGRGGNYSQTELEQWGARLRRWRREREVYAYFHNDWKGYAPANALALRNALDA